LVRSSLLAGLLMCSVATVRFGSVQEPIWLNPEPNLRFGSGICLNLEPNLEEPVQVVRFRFKRGSNHEPNLNFCK